VDRPGGDLPAVSHASAFFTTPHFNGHCSVLLRSSRIAELTQQELAEVVQDAWLAQASPRRRTACLAEHPSPGPRND